MHSSSCIPPSMIVSLLIRYFLHLFLNVNHLVAFMVKPTGVALFVVFHRGQVGFSSTPSSDWLDCK